MATETKLTAKQASVKITKILKGIDNSTTQIQKHQAIIGGAVPELHKLFGGLPNSAQPVKPNGQKQTKPADKAKTKPAKAPAKSAAKTVKPTKAPKPTSKPSKADKPKSPAPGRPALKQAIQNVMSSNNGPMTAADVWKAATNKYGEWTRQSVYMALKDKKLFSRSGNEFTLLAKVKSDAKAEEFVATVAADPSVSKVV